MADEHDILLQFWQDQRDQIRQLETQRATLTNTILVVASVAVGLVFHQGISDHLVLGVTVGMTALGLYGAAVSLKYRERCDLHLAQAAAIRYRLDTAFPHMALEADRQAARADHRSRHRLWCRLRLYALWTALHAGVALAGAVMSIVVLLNR
ncbi:hypothetical protein [Streptomyces sp. NPDC016845]|uniref:hypothetical protein n=1 Tax=Streptomyces sp. NPDC016845 TaxID=3364972 RepID=UPI00378F831E